MLHSFHHRPRVHPSPFSHSPTSHFSPTGNSSSSPKRPMEKANASNAQQLPQVHSNLYGYHISTTLWPRKKRRAPDLPRSESVGTSIDSLHPSYVDADWALKRCRIKWERWEGKGGFNIKVKPSSSQNLSLTSLWRMTLV